MTAASLSFALPLAIAIAMAVGWGLSKRGIDRQLASLWAVTISGLLGVAALLSDSPAGMLRAVWPREAVDWLPIAASLLTAVAAVQQRPVRLGGSTLWIGSLLGMLIVCRFLYGTVYLRPGHTSVANLAAIAVAGFVIGSSWHLELARPSKPTMLESLTVVGMALMTSATLGMSGSFQYAMVGLLVTLSSLSAWCAARCWPWIANMLIWMLLGLGFAFAELNWQSFIALGLALFACSFTGVLPAKERLLRAKTIVLVLAACVALTCTGLNTQRFLKDIKGNNAAHGGYEAYR